MPTLTQEDLTEFVEVHESQTHEDLDTIITMFLVSTYPTQLAQDN